MIHIVIIGAGQGGSALLRAFRGMPQLKVLGVVDHRPDAPGMALASQLGIPTATDYRRLITQSDVDIIVQATGDSSLDQELARLKTPRASIVEGLTMYLLLNLVDEAERLLKALQAKERERDYILNSTHDGVLAVNAQGIITIANAAAERLTGLAGANLLGMHAETVIPGTRLHLVLETGQAELNQRQQMGDTIVVTNRVPVRDEQGNIVGAVSVFRDISEVEELSGQKEMKQLLEAVINATQDAISVVDASGRGLLINPAYTLLTGLTPQQVIGKPATVDIDETQESMHLQVLRTLRPVRGVPMQVGPKKRDVIVNVAPIIVDNQLKGSVGVIHDMSEITRLTRELENVKQLVRKLSAKYTFEDIVAESAVMQAAVDQAKRAADTPATVLLRGESGTGKELFAHAIHTASSRRSGQFIRVNCAAIADTLLESELFGYVEGAFTGAKKGGRKGLFEEANGGTLFLDEIGEISLNLQAKLLRVLQEREIVRVGDNRPVPVNVRVIAATNAKLEELMHQGRFREDLYYRLNVVPIHIPPLRHRREDIPWLVTNLIEKFNREYGRQVERVHPLVMADLVHRPWPGNVRELENIIGRAIIAMGFAGSEILPVHLPAQNGPEATGQNGPVAGAAQTGWDGRSLTELVDQAERQVLTAALTACGGNKTEAARRLQVSTRTLYYKLERHGLLSASGGWAREGG